MAATVYSIQYVRKKIACGDWTSQEGKERGRQWENKKTVGVEKFAALLIEKHKFAGKVEAESKFNMWFLPFFPYLYV